MRIVTRIAALAMVLFLGLGAACAQAEGITYVDAGDKTVQMEDDFSLRAVVQRKSAKGAMECTIRFYEQDESCYTVYLRWMRGKRVDLSIEKHVKGEFKGSMIAMENEGAHKLNYVSVDDGWDATDDTELELVLTVRENIASLAMKGNVTGNNVTLHYDLTATPWLEGMTVGEHNPVKLNKGTMTPDIRGGTLAALEVDVNTSKGKKADLPKDEWYEA